MNIIILSGATGGGHNRASGALKEALLKKHSDANVHIIDVFVECSKMLNVTVTQGYKLLAVKAPKLYGAMYKTADRETPLYELMNSINLQCGRKILPVIKEYRPDVVVCCHPFAVTMMSTIKEKFGYDVPTVAIVTDFMPHMAYICENMDAYVTASDETADALCEKYHVDRDIIHPLGLPIYDRFYQKDGFDKDAFLREMSLDPALPTVLIMAGSFGVTDILKIYEKLAEVPAQFQIIVITGKNKKLYDAFERLLSDEEEFETQDAPDFILSLSDDNIFKMMYDRGEELREQIKSTFKRSTHMKKPTKLLYFVDNVEDYMHSSDLIITKPGGLTTSESIACNLPMAIFKAIPGQEEQNAEYLVKNGIAIAIDKGDLLKAQIENLLSQPDRLESMRLSCRRCMRKNAAENIVSLIEGFADRHFSESE